VLYFDPMNTRITVAAYTKHLDVQPVWRASIGTLCVSTLGMENVVIRSMRTSHGVFFFFFLTDGGPGVPIKPKR